MHTILYWVSRLLIGYVVLDGLLTLITYYNYPNYYGAGVNVLFRAYYCSIGTPCGILAAHYLDGKVKYSRYIIGSIMIGIFLVGNYWIK